MPRLLPGGTVAQEARDVLQIRGPPVLSMGRLVEENEAPTCFVYGQGWQGLIYGNRATQIKRMCLLAERDREALPTPTENFIPRFHPGGAGRHAGVRASPNQKKDLLGNTEEATQELLVRSGAETALSEGTSPSNTPEQAINPALANPECASRIEAILRSKLAELKAYCAHVECPDDIHVLEKVDADTDTFSDNLEAEIEREVAQIIKEHEAFTRGLCDSPVP